MFKEINHTGVSMMQKMNHIGMALFVFVILTGTILRLTGNLHFGPTPVAEASYDGRGLDDAHRHGTGDNLCQKHRIPESVCVQCNPSLAPSFKEKGDWCAEHNLPESQCAVCNVDLRQFATGDIGSTTDLSALEKATCEHGVRTIECDRCRFEVGVVKLQPSLAETLIKTGVVEELERVNTLRLTGQVELDKTRAVDVVPMGSGQIKRVEKLLGQKVEKGDVLAAIHSADLGQAKAQFLEVQAKLELASATHKREKELYEKKISSEADYLSALNELTGAQANYAAAEKRLRLFGLGTEQIVTIKDEKENEHFAELVLCAPQAGTIIAQNISAGTLVDTTQSLYTIADLSNVWVWCDLYEKDLAALHQQFSAGQEVRAKVRVKAFEAVVFEGVVDLIGSAVDEHTRTIKLRVQVTNEERKLKPGMFADAEILVPLAGRIAVVPRNAVLSDEGKTFVFQRWKGDLWVRRDVIVGRRQGHLVEIVDGIAKGARVVTGGAFMLKSDILREKMGAGCAD